MRRLLITLSFLSFSLLGLACQKDVHEVRRDLGPVAPGSNYGKTRTASAKAPVTPSGAPVGIGAAPRSPTDTR